MRVNDPYGCYWQIGVSFGTELADADNLGLQYYALTASGKVFAGYQTFAGVEASACHEHAAYLPHCALASQTPEGRLVLDEIRDVRYEVHGAGRILASGALAATPAAEWWKAAEPQPLEFLRPIRWSWYSASLDTVTHEGLVLGRGPEREPFSLGQDEAAPKR